MDLFESMTGKFKVIWVSLLELERFETVTMQGEKVEMNSANGVAECT